MMGDTLVLPEFCNPFEEHPVSWEWLQDLDKDKKTIRVKTYTSLGAFYCHMFLELQRLIREAYRYIEIEMPREMSDRDREQVARTLCQCYPGRIDWFYEDSSDPFWGEGATRCRPIKNEVCPPASWAYRLRVWDVWVCGPDDPEPPEPTEESKSKRSCEEEDDGVIEEFD